VEWDLIQAREVSLGIDWLGWTHLEFVMSSYWITGGRGIKATAALGVKCN